MFQGGEGGDDDTPDVPKGHGKIASGKGVCEASKNAGKEPVRNSHKKAHVAWDGVSIIMFSCSEF